MLVGLSFISDQFSVGLLVDVFLLMLLCNSLFANYICEILTSVYLVTIGLLLFILAWFLINFIFLILWFPKISSIFVYYCLILTIWPLLLRNILIIYLIVWNHFFILLTFFWENFSILSLKILKMMIFVLILIQSRCVNTRFKILRNLIALIIQEILIIVISSSLFFVTGCHIN